MHNQTKFLMIAAILAAAIVSVTLYTAAATANAQGTNMTKNAAGTSSSNMTKNMTASAGNMTKSKNMTAGK